jgi:hypothetical protein
MVSIMDITNMILWKSREGNSVRKFQVWRSEPWYTTRLCKQFNTWLLPFMIDSHCPCFQQRTTVAKGTFSLAYVLIFFTIKNCKHVGLFLKILLEKTLKLGWHARPSDCSTFANSFALILRGCLLPPKKPRA